MCAEYEKMLENEIIMKTDANTHSGSVKSKLELSIFPSEGSEEYAFFHKVITAVQNWFTVFGWSKGPNPISIPRSLRR